MNHIRDRAGILIMGPNPRAGRGLVVTTVFVTYPGDSSTFFDRDYYVREHVPLVMEAWGPHGLESCTAFFPASEGGGTIAVAVCEFRDEAALESALASPRTPQVMADVVNFTTAQPCQSRAAPI